MGFKVVVNSGPGFSFAIETYPSRVFVHCDVTDNKPSVLKEMFRRWKKIRESFIIDLYAIHNATENKPSKHFLKMFGFEYLRTVKAKNGIDIIEIWINKQGV